MNAIEIESLNHSFGSRAVLHDVSFAVPEGSLAVLTGANGSGKSTLIALLANLYGVRSGRIRIFGHELPRRAPTALALVGIVFQRQALDLDLTVAENLAYHLALHGFDPHKGKALMQEEMERQGLADRLHSRARELSVGQRRRVEIGRALLLRPLLLLLDEPTASLDGQGRRLLLARVQELKQERRMSVLWTSHHAEEIAEADMELKMAGGRLT